MKPPHLIRTSEAFTVLLLAILAYSVHANGNAERGRKLYQAECMECHSPDANGPGPAHRGVYGRLPAQALGYPYSPALKSIKVIWDEQTLDQWLTDPSAYAPGARMGFNLSDPAERADVIAYLKTLTAK